MQKRSADAEELIRQYKDITDEEKLIHRQYIQMAEAISNYNKAGKLTAVLQQLKTSLHLTTAEIKGQNIHLFHQEIYLIYMIFWMQYQCGDTERLLDNARKMEQYICEQYTDEEEKVKIYPQCIWLLGRILLDIQYDKTAKYTINKGIDCLTENGALHWLTQLLELKKECEERLGEKAEVEECDRYLDAIRTLYEVAGECQTKEISLALFMQSSTQRECIISNYFLKNLREEKEKNNKAIILLTDGENNDGSLSMAQAIGLAEKEGIKIYTVGVGSDRNFLGSLFGLGNGELDEKSLKELAQRTKGNYFRATDVNSLAEIYTKIDQLEPAKSEGNIVQEKKDLFYVPLTFALILTLFLLFLPGRYLK